MMNSKEFMPEQQQSKLDCNAQQEGELNSQADTEKSCHEVPTIYEISSSENRKILIKMNSKAVVLIVLSSLVALSTCCKVKSTSYTTDGELKEKHSS